MLKINLLPPKRRPPVVEDCIAICKDSAAGVGMLLVLPFLAVGALICMAGAGVWRAGVFVRREIRRRVSAKQAIEIAIRAAEGEGRQCWTHLEEKGDTYEVRVDVAHTCVVGENCKMLRLTVDMHDGRVLDTTEIPCIFKQTTGFGYRVPVRCACMRLDQ